MDNVFQSLFHRQSQTSCNDHHHLALGLEESVFLRNRLVAVWCFASQAAWATTLFDTERVVLQPTTVWDEFTEGRMRILLVSFSIFQGIIYLFETIPYFYYIWLTSSSVCTKRFACNRVMISERRSLTGAMLSSTTPIRSGWLSAAFLSCNRFLHLAIFDSLSLSDIFLINPTDRVKIDIKTGWSGRAEW